MKTVQPSTVEQEHIISQVQSWLTEVVIGLNLCPFAARPTKAGQVRFVVSEARDEESLLQDLQSELERLETTAPSTLETTLLIIPLMLRDFMDYNLYLNWVDQLIARRGWDGEFQVASFHPDYQFEGTDAEDAENLTNRSPYPILHLLREQSLENMLARYPDSDQIPENNIQRMNRLSEVEKQKLFPFLFPNK
ncbi:DUF1415 domain-containing protein [Aestuariicella sp. G3-2]|uniref:DUF1415 domain-containing protein n=1 Tax=Pseudomaricurvus albidus TaxID=2842452 RepID=UPI001C0BC551|nr:DUF1415 domain-containing protein [Aestuariicella albida]MBU3069942.1 DUF1415 domain-containing protein [Aestuariicella albida]